MHFAGLKAVQESVEQPLQYYDHNVIGSHRLLSAMKNCGVRQIVFSSSATVYGKPVALPFAENHPLLPVDPYGRAKLIIEDMLRDQCTSDPSWGVAILRYFNPAGAHLERPDWRKKKRHAEQSGSVGRSGGDRAPRTPAGFGEATTTLQMERAYVTTCTSWTWLMGMLLRFGSCRSKTISRSISGRDAAIACWRCSQSPSNRQVEKAFPSI